MAPYGAAAMQVAPLSRRFIAVIIDSVIPAAVMLIALLAQSHLDAGVASVVFAVCILVLCGWALFLWWRYALTGAGPGYQLAGLTLLGLVDGEPIGWGRFFLRQLILGLLCASGIGLIALLVTMATNDRRQGWHDMVAGSVAVYRHAINRAAAPSSVPSWQSTTASQAAEWAPGYSGPSRRPVPAQPVGRFAPAFPTTPVPAPAGPPVPVAASSRGVPLTPPPDAYLAPDHDEEPASAETPIAPESAREAALEAARARGWLPRSASGMNSQFSPPHVSPASVTPPPGGLGAYLDYGWYLVLDDGRQVDITRPVVIGRNPVPPPEHADALLVSVGETGQAVSKTHLSVSVDGSGLFIVDYGSTNGTAVVGTTGALEPCKANHEVRVRDGQVVSFGDHAFTVRRRPRR